MLVGRRDDDNDNDNDERGEEEGEIEGREIKRNMWWDQDSNNNSYQFLKEMGKLYGGIGLGRIPL